MASSSRIASPGLRGTSRASSNRGKHACQASFATDAISWAGAPWRLVKHFSLLARPQAAPSRPSSTAAVGAGDALEPIDTSRLTPTQAVPGLADLLYATSHPAHPECPSFIEGTAIPFARGAIEPLSGERGLLRGGGRLTKGRAAVCTTIDPYDFQSAGFAARVNSRLNADFEAGAIAVKLDKVVGMEVRRKDGTYVLPG